jgi:hypothetical protein
MVDSSKSSSATSTSHGHGAIADSETRSFYDRQTALAAVVGDLLAQHRSADADNRPHTLKKQPRQKVSGGLSRGLIEGEAANAANISSPRGVLVPALLDAQKNVDSQVEQLRQRRDAREEEFDSYQQGHGVSATVAGVHKFLNEALATKASSNMLRKANLLTTGRAGRNAGFGWALEGLLQETLKNEGGADEEKQEKKLKAAKRTVLVPVKATPATADA